MDRVRHGVLEYRSTGILGLEFITPVLHHSITPVLLILQPHFRTKILTVLVGLEARRVNTVSGQLFVALLRVSGNPHSADDFAVLIANQHAAAFGKNLIVRSTDQILHEQRPFFRPDTDQRRGSAQGEGGISLTVSHLEAHHCRPIFLLKCFHLSPGLNHHDTEWTATQLTAARKNRLDDAIRLFQADHGRLSSFAAINQYRSFTVEKNKRERCIQSPQLKRTFASSARYFSVDAWSDPRTSNI